MFEVILILCVYLISVYFIKFKSQKLNLCINICSHIVAIVVFLAGVINANEDMQVYSLGAEMLFVVVLTFMILDRHNTIHYKRLSQYTSKIILFASDFFRREEELKMIVDTLDEILNEEKIRWLWFSTGRYEDEVIICPEEDVTIIKQRAGLLEQCRVLENKRGNVIFLRFVKK